MNVASELEKHVHVLYPIILYILLCCWIKVVYVNYILLVDDIVELDCVLNDFCLPGVSISERRVLKPLFMIMDTSISSCISISFCFV